MTRDLFPGEIVNCNGLYDYVCLNTDGTVSKVRRLAHYSATGLAASARCSSTTQKATVVPTGTEPNWDNV